MIDPREKPMDRLRRLAYSSARGIASEYIMIADRNIRSDYSAEVRLQLEAQGKVWPLAKIGRGHIVPSAPIELPPCDAVVIMTVDGDERRWNVRLVDGASPLDTDVRTRPR